MSSTDSETTSAASLRHISDEVQVQIVGAEALVRKYGHEGPFDSLLRWETKEEVEAKFDGVVGELNQVGLGGCMMSRKVAGQQIMVPVCHARHH